MDLRWLDQQTAQVSDQPAITVRFAEAEDDAIPDIVLSMLLQSFSK